MVLEESLLFINDADADQFIRFLKGKNCRAQKRHEGHVVEDILMVGSLGNLIAMLEGEITADPELYCRSQDNDEHLLLRTLMEQLEKEEMTNDVMIPLMLENAKQTRDYIADVNNRFNEGDVFSAPGFPADFTGDKHSLEQMLEEKSRDDLESNLDELFSLITHLKVMVENNLVKGGPDGFVLLKKMNPDDVSIEYPVTDLELINIEAQETHHLSLIRKISLSTRTLVSTDPYLYYACTGEELLDAISSLRVDEESLDHLLFNFYYKGIVVNQIIDLIGGEGKISLSAIIEQAEILINRVMRDLEKDQNELESFTLISPEFVTGLINDLRKVVVIRGNDTKIRLSMS